MAKGLNDMQALLEVCECPRKEGEKFTSPCCKVVMDTGEGEDEGPVFVEMPAELRCPKGRRLSYGEFCTDQNRIRLFRRLGV